MRIKKDITVIKKLLLENFKDAKSELVWKNHYELIVCVILSAQCTDKRVNLVTPALFAAYPTVEALSKASAEDIYPFIKSVSYPNNKAKNLAAMARKVMDDFGGKIPSDVDNLMKLPGAGRKTANVVASILYNEPVVAVDTHVFRVSRRLGLSRGTTPRAVELDLERHIPQDIRPVAHHWLLLHGRYTCTSQKPKCSECPLAAFCKNYPI